MSYALIRGTNSGRAEGVTVRIIGVDIPDNKRGEIALTYIFGVGRNGALRILERAGIDPGKLAGEFTGDEVIAIRDAISELGIVTEGYLRKENTLNIKRLIEIKSYRGIRHRRNLPVRGQRTHTNARTRKGPRRQAIAGRKRPVKK
jgi:small subunit ribosomal protein S13